MFNSFVSKSGTKKELSILSKSFRNCDSQPGERPQALLDPDGDCALDQEIMNFFMYDGHRH